MKVSSINVKNPHYAGRVAASSSAPIDNAYKLNYPKDKVDLSKNKVVPLEAPLGKKIAVGAASFVLPGLGQILNGEAKKGHRDLILNFALRFGACGLAVICPPAAFAMAGAALAVNISSVVDAVKNA